METRSRSSHIDADELQKLVRKLERDLRAWKKATSLIFVSVLLTFCAGGGLYQKTPDYVTARKGFLVEDERGHTRSFLGIEDDGRVGLHVTDEKGKKRIGMAMNPRGKGYGIVVYDDEERLRSFLGLVEGSFCLHFYDEKDIPRVTLGHRKTPGFSGLWVRDDRGVQRLILGDVQKVDNVPGAETGLFLLDEKLRARLQIYAADGRWPVMKFADDERRLRLKLGLESGGDKSVFSMHGKDADERVILEVERGQDNRREIRDS